jgi:HAD superfamily hydrolase (TIGR01509 family)
MTERDPGTADGSRAVVFDMDGLMVDTEPLQFAAFRRQLWDDYRIELHDEDVRAMVGHRIDENWRYLKARHDIPESIDTLIVRRDALYRPILEQEVAPLPGVVRLIARLAAAGYRLGLASSSPYWQIDTVVDRLDVRSHFAAFASGEEVAESKPHPAIYLLVARRLGRPPASCLALEDSEPGVTAARAAGMRCIAVPNAYTRGQDLSRADLILPSLAGDEPLARIDRLLGS